jgi:uncharacterized protein involved in exopolysaccharide biosynthesis
MPDVVSIFSRWWKPIVLLTAITTVLTWIVVSLLPKQYLSVATALPASSTATDKASIFNTTILTLYPSIGTTDDLDKVVGTARLDTLYLAAAQKLDLPKHYGLPNDEFALYNAAQKLKKNTRINKSEWAELKIKVWDEDREKAAQLANGLLQQLQQMHQQLQSQSNALILQNIKKEYAQLRAAGGTDTSLIKETTTKIIFNNEAKKEQLLQYEKLINEYSLMVNTNPPVLLVVEAARPALYPDRPDVLQNVVIAFIASIVFSMLLVVFLVGNKKEA